jgi:hypothetical protein
MPLFRRRAAEQQTDWFTVGVLGHRCIPGSRTPGIEQLEGLDDYVEAIRQRRPPGADGRDSIAVLNAKMDHADSVDDLVAAVVLASEELVERGLLDESLAPASPPHAAMAEDRGTYHYIQQVHQRAVERRQWLDDVDILFRLNGVALLAPYPVEE